jgi:hypothetical protein
VLPEVAVLVTVAAGLAVGAAGSRMLPTPLAKGVGAVRQRVPPAPLAKGVGAVRQRVPPAPLATTLETLGAAKVIESPESLVCEARTVK